MWLTARLTLPIWSMGIVHRACRPNFEKICLKNCFVTKICSVEKFSFKDLAPEHNRFRGRIRCWNSNLRWPQSETQCKMYFLPWNWSNVVFAPFGTAILSSLRPEMKLPCLNVIQIITLAAFQPVHSKKKIFHKCFSILIKPFKQPQTYFYLKTIASVLKHLNT